MSKTLRDVSEFKSVRCITRGELKQILGNISERTLKRMEAVGDSPVKTRLSAGRVGYRLNDVEAWLDGRRMEIGGAA
jgi:hypothetical protein